MFALYRSGMNVEKQNFYGLSIDENKIKTEYTEQA